MDTKAVFKKQYLEELEARENLTLAPAAQLSKETLGRNYEASPEVCALCISAIKIRSYTQRRLGVYPIKHRYFWHLREITTELV